MSNSYQIGKQHYWEGLPITAMDHAETSSKIEWLSGWLDARLEHRFIKKTANRSSNNAIRMDQGRASTAC